MGLLEMLEETLAGGLGVAVELLLLVPLAGRSGIIDGGHLLMRGTSTLRDGSGALSKEVATNEGGVGEQLAGLGVGEEKLEKGTDVLSSCRVLVRKLLEVLLQRRVATDPRCAAAWPHLWTRVRTPFRA